MRSLIQRAAWYLGGAVVVVVLLWALSEPISRVVAGAVATFWSVLFQLVEPIALLLFVFLLVKALWRR